MKRNNITLQEHHAFLTVHRLGSFRLAADELGVSASSLSRQIASLEERLQTRLFNRDTRNVEITASGETLALISERMVNTSDACMAELESYLSARHGKLVIAGLPSVTAGLLPKLLSSFTRTHPQVDLQILDALSETVLKTVETGVADIGFTAGTVSTRSRLSFHPLLTDKFVAVGCSDGPLAEERTYSMSELVELPFIAMAKGTSVRELLDGVCLQRGLSLTPRFEVAHLATAGALVTEGLGITTLPKLTLPVLRTDMLIQRPISDFDADRRIGLVHRSGHSVSPAADAFIQHVRQNLLGLQST